MRVCNATEALGLVDSLASRWLVERAELNVYSLASRGYQRRDVEVVLMRARK